MMPPARLLEIILGVTTGTCTFCLWSERRHHSPWDHRRLRSLNSLAIGILRHQIAADGQSGRTSVLKLGP